jgi:hypothetical protein
VPIRSVLIIPSVLALASAASACDPAPPGSRPAEVAVVQRPDATVIESGPGDTEGASDPDDGIAPTGLPLTLLATLVGEDGRATIRDDDGGIIASYRVGETVRPGVTVAIIEPRGVTLDEGGTPSRLAFGEGPATLSADDVYYPDLARFDDLPSSMADAIQLEDGEGYVVKAPAFAWGTPRTIAALRDGLRAYARAHPDASVVYVGDLSKEGGGPFPPHLSHQYGRDVDIGLLHVGASAGARRFVRAAPRNLDFERTWDLLVALLETKEVAYMFLDYELQGWLYEWATQRGVNPAKLDEWFQYPKGRAAMHGVIRHWKGHADHVHVRYRQ